MAPTAVRVLLESIVDYAGLFPPAKLPMAEAVRNYAAYRAGDASWMLGRFIVPVARLDEFERAAGALLPSTAGDSWLLGALAGSDVEDDMGAIRAFNERLSGKAVVDSIEARAADAAGVARVGEAVPPSLPAFVEVPIDEDPTAVLAAIAGWGLCAKARTGGVTEDAIPPVADVARFIAACSLAGVPFKATAGLHHPVRALRRLTYEPDSPSATMHGFLNVFFAAALGRLGMDEERLAEVLEESSPDAFRFEPDAIAWRDHRLALDEVRAARNTFAISFGSCSFVEPIEDLEALHVL